MYKKLISLIAFASSIFAINNYPAAAPKKPIEVASQTPAIQQSYLANAKNLSKEAIEQLKKNKQCNTDLVDKNKTAKEEYRALVFEAATALGHPHPELIMVINNKEYRAAAGGCHIGKEIGRGIIIDQDELDKDTYGSRRITIYHEVAHLTNRDTTNDSQRKSNAIKTLKDTTKLALDKLLKDPTNKALKKSYDEEFAKQEALFSKDMGQGQKDFLYNCEFLADRDAAQAARCHVCARQKGDFFFQYREMLYAQNLHLKDIQKMDFNQLTKLIEKLEPQSKAYCLQTKDCHPLCIERAVRFYRYALSEGIQDNLCTYHTNEKILAAKKKAEKAEAQKKFDAAVAFHKDRRAKEQAARQQARLGIKDQAEQINVKHATEKVSPAPCAGDVLFTPQELSTKKYKEKTVDTLLGQPVKESDGWDFDKNNKFTRGDIVSILRSSGNWTYGIVLFHNDNGVTVQVESDTYKEQLLPEIVGKNIA